jgi:hypothetical protein
MGPMFGPIWIQIGPIQMSPIGPQFGTQLGPNWVPILGRIGPMLDHVYIESVSYLWPNWAHWPIWVYFGPNWVPIFGRIGPILGPNLGPNSANLGPNWAQFLDHVLYIYIYIYYVYIYIYIYIHVYIYEASANRGPRRDANYTVRTL